MAIQWSIATEDVSSDLSVSGQSSEASGFAATNLLERSGLACGPSWKTSSGSSHWVDLDDWPAIRSGFTVWAALLHTDIPEAATVQLKSGHQGSMGSAVVGTFTRTPAGQWILWEDGGTFAGGDAHIRIAPGSSVVVEVPLLVVGYARQVFSTVAIPSVTAITRDPSQRWETPHGRVLVRKQRLKRSFRLGFQFPVDGEDFLRFRTAIEDFGEQGIFAIFADVDDLDGLAQAMVGTLRQTPEYAFVNGSPMCRFDIQVDEVPR